MTDLFDDRPQYGTPPEHLTRTDDPDTSHEAGEQVDTTRLEAMVHRAIACSLDGCIASDLLTHFHTFPYSSITARFAALERNGFITCGPDKRKGRSGRNQRVMRSIRAPIKGDK